MSTSRPLYAVRGRGGHPRRAPRWSAPTLAAMIFAVVVLVVAGVGFIYKMTEFAMTIVNDDIEGFGAAAVSVYLIGMVPILFLTLWAVFTGKFRDIERPKFRLFELDREIEQEARRAERDGHD
jgi:hypothetical protein